MKYNKEPSFLLLGSFCFKSQQQALAGKESKC
nr:MAG TPA: hypothetical protein [Caudoviricetes sp.]